MLRWFLVVLLLVALPAYACEVIDDAGHHIDLKQPAQRIVSLAPDITENLFAAGAGNQIVGVVSGSDYPPAARSITSVGSYTGLDLEKLLLLHPDLIVAWGSTFTRQLMALKKMGIPVYITQPRRLEDIPRTLKNLGCLAGTPEQAKVAANSFLLRLSQLKQRYQNRPPVRVFYEIGDYGLMTVNQESWINQAIELCGGNNVFAQARTISPAVSWEAVVLANPQVVISDSQNKDWPKRWQRWPQIEAVKQHRLLSLSPDLIERASPRLLLGTAQLCQYLSNPT